MLRYLAFSMALVALWGCQASNPYQASGLALPPAPPAAATHFDASAYPVAPQLKSYTYWCWHNQQTRANDTLAAQDTAASIVAEQLEQYGLRAASSPAQCQLKVLFTRQHNQLIQRSYYDSPYPSANFGYGYGTHRHPYDRYGYSGIGLSVPVLPQTYTEYYQQLSLTFSDAQSGLLVWRGQSTVSSDHNAQVAEQALRKAINTMLDQYRHN